MRELLRLRERRRLINRVRLHVRSCVRLRVRPCVRLGVRLCVRLHVREIGRRRKFRCEHRRDRPRAIEVLRRGTFARSHVLKAPHLWPLPGLGKIVAILPRRPPISAHDNARLVIPDDERLDARAIRVRTVTRSRTSSGNVGGTRHRRTHHPNCNCRNRASTHRNNSSSSKWILSI